MNIPSDMSGVMSYVLKTMVHRDPGYKQLERERLEKNKLQYEHLLHSILNRNEDTIKQCIYLYSDISTKIKTTRTNIKLLKERLVQCKDVMNLDYENLSYLFHNSAMYNEIMTLLEKIEKFLSVSTMIDNCMAQKDYVSGAKILKTAYENYDKFLCHINALSTRRIDLDAKFQIYYEFLIQELLKILFENVNFHEIDKRHSKPVNMSISDFEHVLNEMVTSLLTLNKLPEVILLLQNNIYRALEKIIVDVIDEFSAKLHDKLLNSYKKESCSIRMFSLLLGALLEKFKKVSDHIKCLFTVISTCELPQAKLEPTIMQNSDYTDDTTEIQNNNMLLYDLNENMKTVWLQIHYALEAFLNCYLPVSSHEYLTKTMSKESLGKDIISKIFSTKYLNNQKFQNSIFHFDSSTISGVFNDMNSNPFKSFVQSNMDAQTNFDISNTPSNRVSDSAETEINKAFLIESARTSKVSWSILRPNFHYIGYVYQTLVGFLENGSAYLEDASGCMGTLNTFIRDYIDSIYIPNIKEEFCGKLNKLMDDPTLLFTLGPVNYWKISPRDSPVAIGVLALFDECLCFVKQLSLIPHYSNTFIDIIVDRINKFVQISNNYLEKLYNPDIDDIYHITAKKKFKSEYANDDTKQFIIVTSFELATNSIFRKKYLEMIEKQPDNNNRNTKSNNQEFVKCYELIISSLSDRTLKEYNMIQKNIHLKTLINAMESFDWLQEVINEIYRYLKSIKRNKSTLKNNHLPMMADINSSLREHISSVIAVKSLESLKSSVNLIRLRHQIIKLAIHLEIRIKCLFNLIPFFDPHNYYIAMADSTIDPIILHVVTDILDFMDMCQNYLHHKNTKFIFSGLSVFLSKLFIDAVGGFKKINQNGIDKMLHNISALKRDLSGCDYLSDSVNNAIVYYELFNKTPNEILKQIKVDGPQFTEKEYTWMIKLTAMLNLSTTSKSENDDHSIARLLAQLKDLFKTYQP